MNRLEKRLQEARKKKKKIFCAYVTLGCPSLAFTQRILLEMEKAGVDIVELGFPFSDPLADGPVIQKASEYALRKQVTMNDGLNLVRTLRKQGFNLPMIFFSYYNPIFHQGVEKTVKRLSEAGFDGLICPDLPPDEDPSLKNEARKKKISVIYLTSPTTSAARLGLISRESSGFIYYVSLKGVTGMRKTLSGDLGAQIRRVKAGTSKPVLIGFGVSTPQQVKKAAAVSDGVIVGSAIMDLAQRTRGNVGQVARFVRQMVQAKE